MNNNFKIGIIGGNGNMGKSLIKFFKSNNHEVFFSDKNTKITNKEVAKLSDIIVIAIPLNCYENVLNEISKELTYEKILMDIGSLKREQVEIMKKYHKGEILATHPLFGPEKNFYGDENSIVVCKINSSFKTEFIIKLFKKNKLNVIELTPDEHDRIMAYIHGFYYLINVSYLSILKEEFASIKNIQNLMTTSFSKYIDSLQHVFNTQDWLIELIAYKNPFINNVIEQFSSQLNKKANLKEIREFLNERIS